MKKIIPFSNKRIFIVKQENYSIEEIKQNDLISNKHKKLCKILNYTEHLPVLASTVTGCVSISAFASLVDIPVGIASSAAEIKICAVTAQIKNYKSIVKVKKKKRDKTVSPAKTKLNTKNS